MKIRRFEAQDRELYLELVKAFYDSPAVLHSIPVEYMERTFDEMIRSDVYVDGFLISTDEDKPMGYALTSKTFSQECGGLAIWFEEMSILPAFQGHGVGSKVFEWIEEYYPKWARIRLEVERDNMGAIRLYNRIGYQELAYYQMVKDKE